jgi:cathepsin B
MFIVVSVLLGCLSSSVTARRQAHPLSQGFADFINGLQTTWTAGVNEHFRGVPMHVIRKMMGVTNIGQPSRLPLAEHLVGDNLIGGLEDVGLPDNFDARTKWPNCPSLFEVRDQAACGSCWAMGATEAMTDRTCIASKGKTKFHISAANLIDCCSDCGDGCDGGEPDAAWQYWVSTGIVTGSNYTAHAGCQPYEIPPCDHHVVGHLPPCGDIVPTPECKRRCIDGYPIDYESDKHFGVKAYSVPSDENAIKQEVYTNGPVEVAFTVYEDLLAYKSGVYHHVAGSELGGHAVKLLGWGVENGTPYWLIVNSWNTDWGDKGLFKILRGQDECGIESQVTAGLPKTNKTPKHHLRQQS